jgi:hypothetical protein
LTGVFRAPMLTAPEGPLRARLGQGAESAHRALRLNRLFLGPKDSTMLTRPLLFLVAASLAIACTSNQSASQSPDAGKYDDYYSEKGGAGSADGGGEGGTKPEPRGVSGTKGVGEKKGVPKALVAKRPTVPGGKKSRRPSGTKPSPTPVKVTAITVAGFVPTDASPGSVIEVMGTGFAKTPAGNTVLIGGKKAKVLEVADDHLVVEVGATSGPVEVYRGKNKRLAKKTEGSFNSMAADNAFGKPRTDSHHGLIGSVFDLGKEVTELPNFGEVGSPVAIIAVPNLDIPAGEWAGGFTGPSGKLSQWFGIHFRGSLNVMEKGSYTICVASGDGSQLYLDENLVVDNDGVHDTTEKCETLTIEPGEYQFDLLYFQAKAGELGLQVTWAKDGGEKAPIPSDVLFPPDDVTSIARK